MAASHRQLRKMAHGNSLNGYPYFIFLCRLCYQIFNYRKVMLKNNENTLEFLVNVSTKSISTQKQACILSKIVFLLKKKHILVSFQAPHLKLRRAIEPLVLFQNFCSKYLFILYPVSLVYLESKMETPKKWVKWVKSYQQRYQNNSIIFSTQLNFTTQLNFIVNFILHISLVFPLFTLNIY